jgi:hypothetical protein
VGNYEDKTSLQYLRDSVGAPSHVPPSAGSIKIDDFGYIPRTDFAKGYFIGCHGYVFLGFILLSFFCVVQDNDISGFVIDFIPVGLYVSLPNIITSQVNRSLSDPFRETFPEAASLFRWVYT